MVTPLEIGTAAAGFVGLAMQCFTSCIQAYEFIQTIRNMGSDTDAVRSRLLWQQKRLSDCWGRINDDSSPLREYLDWNLIYNLLKEQNEYLTSAKKLKAKYKFDVSEEEIDMTEVQTDIEQSTLGKLLARVEQNPTRRELTIATTIKTFQWAAIGRKRAFKIIEDISEINDRLHVLLDSRDREWTRMVHEALVRKLISTSDTQSELEAILPLLQQQEPRMDSRLAAAAELKSFVSIFIDKKPGKPRRQLELTCIKYRKLQPLAGESLLPDTGLTMGSYRKKKVLIEWRVTDEADWEIMKSPMADLAVLLTTMDRESFPVLPFKGLVRDMNNRFALVYELPFTPKDENAEVKSISLYRLISEGYRASLTCRLAIALRLAEALLQFHTAGWLHKGIRTENIIFISTSGITPEELMEGEAYLVGFEHARPDSEMGKALTRLPTTSLESDLYRHPKARGVDRQPFEKSFDVYSLGCVLLELARWERLSDIHPEYEGLGEDIRCAEANGETMKLPSLEGWGSRSQEVSAVAHAAGKSFAEVVALCFDTDAAQKLSSSLELQQRIVDEIRACRI